MADNDPLTPGEIRRSLRRLEDEDRAQATRLTQLAAEMLPVKLWDAEHRALGEKVDRQEKVAEERQRRNEQAFKDLQEEIKDMRDDQEKRSEVTWQKVVGLVVALATIAGVIVTLIGQSKGVH